MRFSRAAAFAFLALSISALSARAEDKPPANLTTPPIKGDKATDFTLNTPAGDAVSLSKLLKEGPVVLVMLRGWPGYQCPICTRQVAEFMASAKEIEKAGARVLLVYPGPAEKLKEHADEFRRGKEMPDNFYFVIDPDYKFTNLYALRWDAPKETTYPSTFVIDRDGTIKFAQTSKTHGGRASGAKVVEALNAGK